MDLKMMSAGAYMSAFRDFFAALDEPVVDYRTLRVGQVLMSKECEYKLKNYCADPIQYRIERIDVAQDQIEYSTWYLGRKTGVRTDNLDDFNYMLNHH